MGAFKTLRPDNFTPEVINQVINLGMRSGTWQESDREYYKDQFLNPRNISIVYCNESGLIVGYILARPHNEAVWDYLDADPIMVKGEIKMFYVDHVNVDESFSGRSLGINLILEMAKIANSQGVFRFSMHCRVINGLSKVIQHKFRKGLDIVRRIEYYVDCNNEPFDYMEINYGNSS